jgi:hypothetical protein
LKNVPSVVKSVMLGD